MRTEKEAAMTETLQSSASIVVNQLADVLVDMPLKVAEEMSERDKHLVLDWVELATACAMRQQFVPTCEVAAVRKCFDEWQRLGKWESFTLWRPQAPLPNQRSLFAD